jgi:hypothetical protein
MKTKISILLFTLFTAFSVKSQTVILPAAMPAGYCQYSYFVNFSVQDHPYGYSFKKTAGSLPSSLVLDTLSGVLHGNFPVYTASTYTFAITARKLSTNALTVKSYTLNVLNKKFTKREMTQIWSRSNLPPIYGDVYSTFFNSLDSAGQGGGGGSINLGNTNLTQTATHRSYNMVTDTLTFGSNTNNTGRFEISCKDIDLHNNFNTNGYRMLNNGTSTLRSSVLLNIITPNLTWNAITNNSFVKFKDDSLVFNSPYITLRSNVVNEFGNGSTFPVIHGDTVLLNIDSLAFIGAVGTTYIAIDPALKTVSVSGVNNVNIIAPITAISNTLTVNGTDNITSFRKSLNNVIDFTSIAPGSNQEIAFFFNGVSAGDPVSAGFLTDLMQSGLLFNVYCNNSSAVRVTAYNPTLIAIDPPSSFVSFSSIK